MKASNAASASFLVSAIQISWSARLAFDCWLLGSLFKTLAVLCTQQRWPRVLGHTSSTSFHDCALSRTPPDGRGREPAGILAEQCDQRLLEITGGDALQIENRDQH